MVHGPFRMNLSFECKEIDGNNVQYTLHASVRAIQRATHRQITPQKPTPRSTLAPPNRLKDKGLIAHCFARINNLQSRAYARAPVLKTRIMGYTKVST